MDDEQKRKEAKALRKARERMPQRTHPWSDFQHQSCGWLNFPLFGVDVGVSPYDPNNFVVVAVGGGGSSKSGIPNGIFMTTVSQHQLDSSVSSRFGHHPHEQFLDLGSVLPFAVSLSSVELCLCAVTIGSKVHVYQFHNDQQIGLEELVSFQADFCEDKPADVSLVRFVSNNIVTSGNDRTIRVWNIDTTLTPCAIKIIAELESIPKDINDLDACMGETPSELRIASASDDGLLRLWCVDSSSSSSSSAALVPRVTFDAPDDGNKDKRAGRSIFKAVRWGKRGAGIDASSLSKRPADSLLLGVQSRLSRGSSYLIVWRVEEEEERKGGGLCGTRSKHVMLSRTRLLVGTQDKVRRMTLTCAPNLSTMTVSFGSAGGYVAALQIEESTGVTSFVGQDVRHATVVSEITSITLADGEACLVTTSMDKGVVLHAAEGLKKKTRQERRKKCCVYGGIFFVLMVLFVGGSWWLGYVDKSTMVMWSNRAKAVLKMNGDSVAMTSGSVEVADGSEGEAAAAAEAATVATASVATASVATTAAVPCSDLAFKNDAECTCSDGAVAIHVNIGSKSDGYLCPEEDVSKEDVSKESTTRRESTGASEENVVAIEVEPTGDVAEAEQTEDVAEEVMASEEVADESNVEKKNQVEQPEAEILANGGDTEGTKEETSIEKEIVAEHEKKNQLSEYEIAEAEIAEAVAAEAEAATKLNDAETRRAEQSQEESLQREEEQPAQQEEPAQQDEPAQEVQLS